MLLSLGFLLLTLLLLFVSYLYGYLCTQRPEFKLNSPSPGTIQTYKFEKELL